MKDLNPLVSVIILNYNGKPFIERCLQSVFETSYPNLEVVFFDNASTDGSIRFVKELFGDDPRLKIVTNRENLGFAVGNNIAAKHARSDFFVFLNNDTEVDPSWINELMSVVLSDPSIGVCGCKVITIDRKTVNSVGAFVDRYGDVYLRGRGAHSVHYKSPVRTFLAHGVAFLIKRKVWEEVGGFDPKYFAGIEDIDLCWRVQLLGYKVVVNPHAVVYHVGEATRNRIIKFHRRRYIATRNILRTLLKNYSISTLVKVLPRYFALTLMELSYLSFSRNDARIAMAYIKALLWNVGNIRDTWLMHQKIQQSRLVSDKAIQARMLKGSAKIAYFLYKSDALTRAFSDLV
jgi:GT2 family glycosyltransferase